MLLVFLLLVTIIIENAGITIHELQESAKDIVRNFWSSSLLLFFCMVSFLLLIEIDIPFGLLPFGFSSVSFGPLVFYQSCWFDWGIPVTVFLHGVIPVTDMMHGVIPVTD
jgi:hypothetical protein